MEEWKVRLGSEGVIEQAFSSPRLYKYWQVGKLFGGAGYRKKKQLGVVPISNGLFKPCSAMAPVRESKWAATSSIARLPLLPINDWLIEGETTLSNVHVACSTTAKRLLLFAAVLCKKKFWVRI